jgi:hypothetical protein
VRHALRGDRSHDREPDGGAARHHPRRQWNATAAATRGQRPRDGDHPRWRRTFVDTLARRIAGFPATAIALAKQSIVNAEQLPLAEGLTEESLLFQRTLRDPEAQAAMRRFLELGGQTREPELRMGDLVTEI